MELRNGQAYAVDSAAEAQKVVSTIRRKAERQVRQLVKSEGPLVDLPPLPQITVRVEDWEPWAAAVEDQAQAANEHLAQYYAAAARMLADLRDEEDIAILLTLL